MVFVKICGITDLDGARAAIDAGADALGFNFWKPGKRYVTPEQAAGIIAAAEKPAGVLAVGVFVDEPPQSVASIAAQAGLDAVQLHGNEPPEYLQAVPGLRVWKAFRVGAGFEIESLRPYPVEAFLLDGAGPTPGGSGTRFDWGIAAEAARVGRIVLAGGLTPQNVAAAVRRARPWGVDVASGVEFSTGKKDPRLVQSFVQAARKVEQS